MKPFIDLDLPGQLIMASSALYLIEIIVKILSGLLITDKLGIIFEVIIALAIAASSPISDDSRKIHFYYSAACWLLIRLFLNPWSIFGHIVVIFYSTIFALIILEDVINAMLQNRTQDLAMKTLIAIGASLFFIESVIHILETNLVDAALLIAVISSILSVFIFSLHFGKEKRISAVFSIVVVALNIIFQTGISGYGSGMVIILVYSIIDLIQSYITRN